MDNTWRKRGLLVPTPTPQNWARSHAALPVGDVTGDGEIELYFSPRDQDGRAHIARAHVQRSAADSTLTLTNQERAPILSPGDLGAFDESGVTVSSLVHIDDRTFLYYTGWTLGVTVPFYFFAGLAIRQPDTLTFKRVSQAPLLERSAVDPYLTASPWVLYENGAWRMWYVSCLDWKLVDGHARHRYHIRYAESDDGIAWRREGQVSIDLADASEYAIGRPCVVRDADCFRMWFSARGDQYRLGYAESLDGVSWQRGDYRAGLEPSDQGWDSEMLAYPAIIDTCGDRYLLYNGNDYGRTGIGYAIQNRGN
jgi:hypothetical protein